MTKFSSFNHKDIQEIPSTALEGDLPVLADPSTVQDNQRVPVRWKDLVTVVGLLSPEKKNALRTILKIDSRTLSDIPIGTVEDAQRNAIRNALQLVNDAPTIKGFLADDRQKIIYFGGNLYGVKRLLYSDFTSTNQRPGYEGTNEQRPINGTGNSNFDNASNQYYTMFFAARNVFSVKLKHTNNNWAVRSLAINNTVRSLTASSGTYTFNFLPASGWISVTRLQFKDDGGNTSLDDLQVLYADSALPTLMNGQVLAIGDYFKVENTNQVLRFEGTDPQSQAWKAVPVSNNLSIDAALDPISTNAIQNRAVYTALEQLRITLGDRIDAIGIVDDLQEWIEKQLLLNALVIHRIDDLYEKLEAKK